VFLECEGPPSVVEAMLLARVNPLVRVYQFHQHGQYKGGKTHVINFEQDVQAAFNVIPRLPSELSRVGSEQGSLRH
jgi:hypothetical protein